jgi:hypothetical protein
VNDGGGWWYYWDEDSTVTDDGGMVVQPGTTPAAGRWIGLLPDDGVLNVRVYGAVCDGTTDDTVALQRCDTWCLAHGYGILINGNIYVGSDPGVGSKVALAHSARFIYPATTFVPSLDVVIDINDTTQHFQCDATHTPILFTKFLYPEWFGEDSVTAHPITDAVVWGDSSKQLWIKSGRLGSATVSGVMSLLAEGYQITMGTRAYDGLNWTNASHLVQLVGGNGGGPSVVLRASLDTYNVDIPNGGLSVGAPSGGNRGMGTVNAQEVYDDNVLLTGYVLDKAFNKKFKISEWDKKSKVKGKKHKQAREFIASRKDMLDVERHSEFIEKNRMLPTFVDVETSQEIPSTGDMIQRLWEVVEIQAVHIKQLNDRIKKLETR